MADNTLGALNFPNFGVPFPYANLLAQLQASMQPPTPGSYARWGGTGTLPTMSGTATTGAGPGMIADSGATGQPFQPAYGPGQSPFQGLPSVRPAGATGLLGLPTAPNNGINPAGYSGAVSAPGPGAGTSGPTTPAPGPVAGPAGLLSQPKSLQQGIAQSQPQPLAYGMPAGYSPGPLPGTYTTPDLPPGAYIRPTSAAASGMTPQEQMARAMLSRSTNPMQLYSALGQEMAGRGMTQDQIAAALNSFGGTGGANGGYQQAMFRQSGNNPSLLGNFAQYFGR